MLFIGDDYTGRIKDKDNLIPENEPAFLLRAQDKHSAQLLRHYAWLCRMDGNIELADKVGDHVLKMDNWQSTVKRKRPDIPTQIKIQF